MENKEYDLWGKHKRSSFRNEINNKYNAMRNLKIEVYDLRERLKELEEEAIRRQDAVEQEGSSGEDYKEFVSRLQKVYGEIDDLKMQISQKERKIEEIQNGLMGRRGHKNSSAEKDEDIDFGNQ